MQWLLTWLDRRFHRWSIPHLPEILGSLQAAAWVLCTFKPELFGRLWLRFVDVQEGEHYRLVTFLAMPACLDVLGLLSVYFYWLIGSGLESHWGSFRYNLYLLINYLCTVVVSYFFPDMFFTNFHMLLSQFLAFAWLFPRFQVCIMWFLPIEIRYLAYIEWFVLVLQFVEGDWNVRLMILTGLANFFIFFADDILARLIRGKRLMEVQMDQIRKKAQGFHRCAVCGITEKDDRDMEFRFCSQCTGDKEYCAVHLRNHDHA